LTTFNSKFDRNINGLENTLTAQEINGFNLFNGKAKCATCHFAPVFNGTVPPNFKESELEAIGVPNDTLTTSKISNDFGRYNLFKTEERKHFFKTPTVRNISKTVPYMHNGVYITLEQVMTFYNNGGGSGVGINLEYQTLPTDSLKLKTAEIQDIIAFMKTLEDK
ncbi:cytochrome-c peroxidase, partial [Pontimicrobium sp. MEBiC01747]